MATTTVAVSSRTSKIGPTVSGQAGASSPTTARKVQRTPGLAVQLLTAGTAACVADLITFPLDTVKVRLQVKGKSGHNYPDLFNSLPL